MLYKDLVYAGVVIILFGIVFFQEGKFFRTFFPVNNNLDKDILVRFLGLLIPILLFGSSIISATKTIFNPGVLAPVSAFSTSISANTFSAIKAATSPSTYTFLVVMGASRIEETILGMVFVIGGVFATYILLLIFYGIINNQMNPFKIHSIVIQKKNQLFVGGMIFSILFFTVLHRNNPIYVANPQLFLFAALFRLGLNILIYKFTALGLSFSIGFHEMWNFFAIKDDILSGGLTTLLSNPFILLYLLYNAVLLFYLIVRLPKVLQQLKLIFTLRSGFSPNGTKS